MSPPPAIDTKMPREGLQRFFVFHVVDNKQSSLGIRRTSVKLTVVYSLRKEVKEITQFLEGKFDRVTG